MHKINVKWCANFKMVKSYFNMFLSSRKTVALRFQTSETYIPRENYSKLNMQKFIINICLSIKIIFQQALVNLVHLEAYKLLHV